MRNQIQGTIQEIWLGEGFAHVVARVGGHLVESIILRKNAEAMKLKVGDPVMVTFRATEVMIAKP